MDWIANPDNGAFPDFVHFAHVALMSALLATALVDDSSRQELRSISMGVEWRRAHNLPSRSLSDMTSRLQSITVSRLVCRQ